MIRRLVKIIGHPQREFLFEMGPSQFRGAIAVRPIEDFKESLIGDELNYLPVKSKAANQFSTGRHCIRLVQEYLSLPAFEVIPGEHGPIWKEGYIGSISHNCEFAVGILMSDLRAVGIDIEHIGRLKAKTANRIATLKEIAQYSEEPTFDWTLLFSAKEAVFKAINPLVRRYFGFREVEIHLDLVNCRFSLEYVGSNLPRDLFQAASGAWTEIGGCLITSVTVD